MLGMLAGEAPRVAHRPASNARNLMRRLLFSTSLVLLGAAMVYPARADAQQSINFYVGGFAPKDFDSRADDDVLSNNLSIFAFELEDFNGPTVGGEWLVALGRNLEGGLGVGFYSQTVPSVYADLVDEDGFEIEQDFKLRVVPFSATIRFLPLGREAPVQPYIGAGVGVFAWRYSEAGDFVDENDDIISARSVGSGGAAGPIVMGGVRFPIGSVDLGGEIRYQNATGELPDDQGFFGSEIDLGGFNYLFTVNVRF
jgi:hypothetical protein